MRILFNPIYDNVLPTEHKEIHYWNLDTKSKKMKKTFKTAKDFKYFPKEISIESEESKINRARDRMKKNQNRGKPDIKKKDIVISAAATKKDSQTANISDKNIEPSKLISGEAGILSPSASKTKTKSTNSEVENKKGVKQA
jgi:DNA-binding protein